MANEIVIEKGLFDDALVEHNKALDINLELLGDKHPEVTSQKDFMLSTYHFYSLQLTQ